MVYNETGMYLIRSDDAPKKIIKIEYYGTQGFMKVYKLTLEGGGECFINEMGRGINYPDNVMVVNKKLLELLEANHE